MGSSVIAQSGQKKWDKMEKVKIECDGKFNFLCKKCAQNERPRPYNWYLLFSHKVQKNTKRDQTNLVAYVLVCAIYFKSECQV